jgi:hypothetical protein
MKNRLFIVLAIITAHYVGLAGTNAPGRSERLGSDAKPASSNAAGPLYSKVDAENPVEFNHLVKVAFVSYGSVEGGAKSLPSYHDALVAAGITNMSCYLSPGTAHEWESWRRSFHQFAPLLFQNP